MLTNTVYFTINGRTKYAYRLADNIARYGRRQRNKARAMRRHRARHARYCAKLAAWLS